MMTKREQYLNLNKNALGDKYIFTDKIEPVGEGGTGIVYVINQVFGKDENIISKRAVKFFVFRDDLMKKYGIVSYNNFKTEISNITQFNHQNVLKVIDGDFYNIKVEDTLYKIPYTITEYIDGKSLEEIISDNNQELCKKYIKTEETVFDIFLEIVDAVQYLHKKKFYHCDIAPKNIFLKTGGENDIFAILGDLGAGYTLEKDRDALIRVIGTYAYMPENVQPLKNKEISNAEFAVLQPGWDIYSLIQTIKNVILKIRDNKIINGETWNLERLYEKISEHNYLSVDELKEDIRHLNPSSGQIFHLDELSEASSNIRPFLIPCGTAILSYRMRKLTKHDSMLRLMEVPQLLEGATTFPGANHTRYEHSLGTYELMRRAILTSLRNRHYVISLSEEGVILALLGALLSSLTNFPYSYAIQELRVHNSELFPELERRKLFRILINQKSRLSNKSLMDCIRELFPKYNINEEDIEYVIFGRADSKKQELEYLFLLLNSSIGVRIIDYIIRDAHHIGISCRIETDNLFNNLAITDGEFCLKQGGISSAEQIISNRAWMFKRIYWSDPNRANAALLKYLFFVTYCNNENIDNLIIEKIKDFDCTKKSIQDILIDNCSDEIKEQVKSIIAFINHKGQQRYKSALVLDSNSKYGSAYQNCEKFYNMNYAEQYEIRTKLENWFINEYNISADESKKGVILLIDIPIENMNNKIGKDIRVKRHDGMILSLNKASALVNGMRGNFEEQLRILRIYIRPDIFDRITEKQTTIKDKMAQGLNQKLCDLI